MRTRSHKRRIALLTHSTNPRGGVVHALELAAALTDLGHEAVVHAPDPDGKGFFRQVRCRTVAVPARPSTGGLRELVGSRIDDYVAYFSRAHAETFDIYHAQDAISGNALATLAESGRIPGYVHTVHHLDDFADAQLAAWQKRSLHSARRVFCVSSLWRDILAREHGISAVQVPSGVDTRRYSPRAGERDAEVRERFGITGRPVFLGIGGVEARKNTLRLFDAFLRLLAIWPQAQLLIAGGASLLDHGEYQAAFNAALRAGGIGVGSGRPLQLTGPVADADMPALYRSANALVFPSLKEGFGLVVLEAMASGIPAIVSRIEPFTEYLGDDDCLWADPFDTTSIAAAMARACEPDVAEVLGRAGLSTSKRFSWHESARCHLAAYASRCTASETIVHA
jgi:glycosyltransferase-like protein